MAGLQLVSLGFALFVSRGCYAQIPSADLLEKLNYTCLVPARENRPLNDTAMGRKLASSFLGIDEPGQPGVPKGVPSCDHDMGDITTMCDHIQPGRFCLYAKKEVTDSVFCVLVNPLQLGEALEIPCPAGLTCAGKAAQPIVCPKGYFCPGGTSQVETCPEGRFCPAAAINISCDPTVSGKFLDGSRCTPDRHGRSSIPEPCDAGSYCIAGLARQCPRGHYCPEGVSKPIPCSETEHCPPGSRMPGRIARAGVEIMVILILCVGLLVTLDWWCLTAELWWVRLLLVFGLLGGVWFYELIRKHRILEPILFLSYSAVLVAWGAVVTPRLHAACGKQDLSILEQIFLTLAGAGCGLLIGSLAEACFLAILIPFMSVAYHFFGGSLSSLRHSSKLLLLLGAYAATVCSIAFLGYWARAVAYVVLCLVWLLWAGCCSLYDRGCSRGQLEDRVREVTASIVPHAADPPDSTELEMSAREGGSDAAPLDHMEIGELRSTGGSYGISFNLVDVSLLLPHGQVILSGINLDIPAGCTVAVMGPSGCGKSSIMNVLSGRAGYGQIRGKIRINGSCGEGRSIAELRSVTGFVPQDDVMHRNLTVEENVSFQAQLRLPREDGESTLVGRANQCEAAATEILEQLGLGDRQLRKTAIGDETVKGVSGGQRKRVSIAMEFVARPSLLFLDEPTSGLDSTTSHAVVDVVTQAARRQRCTTIAVIHQPRYETLRLFDNVILLAAGGYLVYSGPTADVEQYFSEVLGVRFPPKANPADTLLDAITVDAASAMLAKGDMKQTGADLQSSTRFGQWLAETWGQHRTTYQKASPAKMDVPLPNLAVQTCTWGQEIFIHMKRAALQLQRDRHQVLANNMLLVVGLAIFCICAPPTAATQELMHPLLALFLLLLTQGVAAQRVFGGRERFVAWREAGVGTNTFFCFLGRDIAALAEVLLAALFFSALYWPLGPLQSSHHTIFWAAFIFVYTAFGLNYICSVFMTPDTAQMMAVVMAFLSFLLVGANPSFSALVAIPFGIGPMVMSLSPMRWAYGYLMHDHMIQKHSAFANPMVAMASQSQLNDRGMPLEWLNKSGWSCKTGSVRWNWQGHPCPEGGNDCWGFRPPNGFVCNLTQLLLLGIFFRAIALLCMVITSRLKASGGGQVLGGASGDVHRNTLLRRLFIIYIVLLTDLEVSLLLETK